MITNIYKNIQIISTNHSIPKHITFLLEFARFVMLEHIFIHPRRNGIIVKERKRLFTRRNSLRFLRTFQFLTNSLIIHIIKGIYKGLIHSIDTFYVVRWQIIVMGTVIAIQRNMQRQTGCRMHFVTTTNTHYREQQQQNFMNRHT